MQNGKETSAMHIRNYVKLLNCIEASMEKFHHLINVKIK